MNGTPPQKSLGAKGMSPRKPTEEPTEMKLSKVTKFVRDKFILVCRAPEQPFLQTSQSNGNKYISCNICDIDDPECISRLTAFADDAERLVNEIVPTHVLKIGNLRFYAIEKQYKGACTCPIEFRADRLTTVTLGDAIGDAALTPHSLHDEIPEGIPSASIADVLDRMVTVGEYQLTATVDVLSMLFPGKRSKRFMVLRDGDRKVEVTLYDKAAERTDESIEGHMVQEVDDNSISMVSVASTAIVDLTKRSVACPETTDPVKNISVVDLRENENGGSQKTPVPIKIENEVKERKREHPERVATPKDVTKKSK